jgi:hypothetical protein
VSDAAGARTYEGLTTGHVGSTLDVFRDFTETPELSGDQLRALVDQLQMVIALVNGNISLGNGVQSSRMGNMAGQNLQYVFNDTATVAEIPHDIGRKPIGWIVVGERFTARAGGACPKLVACGSDGNIQFGGGENAIDNIPSDWDNRMVYFTAEGDGGWLPGLFRIWLF